MSETTVTGATIRGAKRLLAGWKSRLSGPTPEEEAEAKRKAEEEAKRKAEEERKKEIERLKKLQQKQHLQSERRKLKEKFLQP